MQQPAPRRADPLVRGRRAAGRGRSRSRRRARGRSGGATARRPRATTLSASRSLASASRSRVKSRPTAAARPATSRAAGLAWSRRPRRTAAEVTGRQRRPSWRAGGAHRLDDEQREAAGGRLQQVRARRPGAAARGSPRPAGRCRCRPAGRASSSVSMPAARIRTTQSATAGRRSRSSARSVAASRTGARGAGPRKKVRKARVSSSHHCRLSRTSSVGRPAPEQRPGQPLEEPVPLPGVDHGPGPGAVPRGPSREGTRRSTSSRHTGSSAPARPATAGLRSHSATGASASRPAVPKHWLRDHRARRAACQRGELGDQPALADAGPPRTDATPAAPRRRSARPDAAGPARSAADQAERDAARGGPWPARPVAGSRRSRCAAP